jgi:outer membrane protein assembly factor BamB
VNRHAYILDTATGKATVDFRAKDWLWTAPAVDGSKIYFGDFGGAVYGLDITTGSELWKPASLEGERVRSGAVLIDGVVVVADRKPVVNFINAADGQVLNRVPLADAGTVRSNLVVYEGAAYFASTNGKLFRAEPASKRVVEIRLSGVKK